MTLVTPGLGRLELSDREHGRLFRLARVGLGALGVVTEVRAAHSESHVGQRSGSSAAAAPHVPDTRRVSPPAKNTTCR